VAKNSLLSRAVNRFEYTLLLKEKSLIQNWRTMVDTSAEKQIVFVAGVQRSGTNMTMDVLERCFDTDLYHERDDRAFDKYEMRPYSVIRSLIEKSKASCVVFKALCELQYATKLLEEFAPAKMMWVYRDYHDVVNSHLVLWTGMPDSLKKIVNDRDSAGWRGRDISDELHALIKEYYYDDISNASACALFWYFRNKLFFEQKLEDDDRVMLISYNSMVTEPQKYFSKMFEFLGLDYTSRVSKKVFSSSVRKKQAPEIDPKISALCDSMMKQLDDLSRI